MQQKHRSYNLMYYNYTGNKAKANVDKFYSLLLFCFWIKKILERIIF